MCNRGQTARQSAGHRCHGMQPSSGTYSSGHLTKPVVVRTFAWTRRALESRGWRYEVWSEAPPVFLGNVRFLAGYRRTGCSRARSSTGCRSDLFGTTVGEAIRKERAWPELMVRAALMHLLWRQQFTVDLIRPLTPDHVLGSAAPLAGDILWGSIGGSRPIGHLRCSDSICLRAQTDPRLRRKCCERGQTIRRYSCDEMAGFLAGGIACDFTPFDGGASRDP